LKIETEIREDHQAKLTVELEGAAMEEAKQRAARSLARQVKIPGFRPGKAPYAMVLRHLGEGAVIEEATEILVNDIYPKAIEEAGIDPYGPGSLEKVDNIDPPKFEFLVPLRAKVELGDYRSVSIPYDYEPVTDEDVNRSIQELRDRQAVMEPADRPVQEGDMVYVRLSGKHIQTPEGEDPTLVRERPMPVVVEAEEADTRTEWPFPGFSRQLVGLSAGDEKTLTHTFSEESQFESLRGVEAEFEVKVEEIKSRTLPELDDDFAQSVGEFTSIDDLYTRVRQDLEEHRQQAYNEEYDEKVLDEMVGLSTVKYAPQMLEREIDNTIEQLKNRLEQQNQDLDLYLKTRNMDMEALREEVRPVAETRLKKTLVLLEISEAEKIKVQPQELEAETARTMEVMQRYLPKADARRLSDRKTVSNLVGNIMMDMVTQKTIERIRQIGRGDAPALNADEGESFPTEAGEAPPDAVASTEEAGAPALSTSAMEPESQPAQDKAEGDEALSESVGGRVEGGAAPGDQASA
jgi:trigger factor